MTSAYGSSHTGYENSYSGMEYDSQYDELLTDPSTLELPSSESESVDGSDLSSASSSFTSYAWNDIRRAGGYDSDVKGHLGSVYGYAKPHDGGLLGLLGLDVGDKMETKLLMQLLTLGIIALFVGLFIAITMAMAGRKKRNSSLESLNDKYYTVGSFILAGLEDLEERIDKMVVGQSDDNSWIGTLYNKFKGSYSGKDTDAEDSEGLDGLEPPNLDETWGLPSLFGEEGHNATETIHARNPRSVEENEVDFEEQKELNEEESLVKNLDFMDGFFSETNGCKFQLYKCIAGVVENGYHHAQKSGGIYEYAQKVFFKVAFNKGFGGGAWNALMTAPEARKVQRCFNAQDECLTQNILMNEVTGDSADGSQEPQRLLINTEYVESLDKSNGSEPYDPENEPDYD